MPERTWTVYDGVNPYARFDGAGDLTTRLLHGPAVDWLLARSDAEGATDWYLTDRLGSVRALADAQGAVINRLDYDAYGNLSRESHPAAGDVFGFTGRERDPVTGLQYNRHRYYDAAIGGWTQPDPIGFAGGDANLYRYVGNGPTNFTDPSGLDKMEAVGWAGDRVALAYIEESWIGFGIWEGAPELIGLFDPNTGLVERNGQFVTIKALRKAFDRGDIDSGRIDPWFADAALGIAQISEQQCKAMALSTRDGAHHPGYYERSIREQDTIGVLAELGISWTAGGADFAGMSHAAALGVVRNGDRVFVLPSNQVVSRFDTVTTAPKGLVQNPMFKHALQPFRGGFTNAGRALTKHPNIVGANSAQELIQQFGNNAGINKAAADALNNIMRNGTCTTKTTKAFGDVVEFKLPNGLGARFNAVTNEFIGFLGRGR